MSTTETEIRHNIVSKDDEVSSAMVFFTGEPPLVAVPEHPNFQKIIDALHQGSDAETIKNLFDTSKAIGKMFDRLSDRVSVKAGKVFFDMEPVQSSLTTAILGFYLEGNEDFKPLVLFMEKIAMNPNEHSREHLYRWIASNKFGITADGDIIAYKGITRDWYSLTHGTAMVNGEVITGTIPNNPDTIIEMPRNEVMFDPAQGCSTGLHVANYHFARDFCHGGKVVQVLVHPRDVVSVPVDAGDQKMRVCRYRVLQPVQAEDKTILFPGSIEQKTAVLKRPEEVKAATAPRATKARTTRDTKATARKSPVKAKGAAKKATKIDANARGRNIKYYEDHKQADFEALPVGTLRWLCKEWEVSPVPRAKKDMAKELVKKARSRKRTWKK